ncbi:MULTISPECIES: hypothetical protein [Serratia]|uniref:hypothetical protein n=1 Tax=Serratia TaxID=613 RepID=UPI0018E44CB2|nr:MULTISPECIES: hypothetical protein [Serratia]MBI6154965.1 hypothetical protein [Serratia surfactantfaciens]HAT4986246.1 hypothetical protein [Serratia marcescens]HAT5032328.1 hypothetical protein [Serratia marcescens]
MIELPNGKVNEYYSYDFDDNIRASSLAGSIPDGLEVHNAINGCVLKGTPVKKGEYQFMIASQYTNRGGDGFNIPPITRIFFKIKIT